MADLNPGHPLPSGGPPPGSGAQVQPTPPATPSATPSGEPGGQQDGKVTISAKEYRDLQRDHARVLSFEKRKEFNRSRNNPPSAPTSSGEGGQDPELLDALQKAQEEKATAETKAMRAEVREKVRDLLSKDEFKTLPESTKALILKNPVMLSEADNVEEAMLDIEDFIRDEVAKIATPGASAQPGPGGGGQPQNPPGHETPPNIAPGTPTPTDTGGMEDVSNLTGPARSRAIIRNKMKEARVAKV